MRFVGYLSGASLLALCVVGPVQAEPAWGSDCRNCHGYMLTNVVNMLGEDLIADPDESGTGDPDRGPLPVFQARRGTTKTIEALIQGLSLDDTYAVQLKRLGRSGVEQGGQLLYTGDCSWPEWDEQNRYYSEPIVSYRWGTGPAEFGYSIDVQAEAGADYYDLVFAVAGELHDGGGLFYAQTHFYLQVTLARGDLNCDGSVDFDDIDPFVAALSGQAAYEAAYPDCIWMNADCDGDGDVDFDDIDPFVALLSGG